MKRNLVGLAVACAVAESASAQSSLTLFGGVDLNARWVRNAGVQQFQLAQDGLAPSRIGLRGTEDLGGGLAAGFWLEGTTNPDTGTPNGQTWQRRSTASLSGGFGEFRFGRDYTATYWNASAFDPLGGRSLGSATNIALVLPGPPSGGAYGTLVRANNMAGYLLPSGIGGGLYGQVQVAAGENALGNKYVGGRVGYAVEPFNVAVAYGRTQVTPDLTGTNVNVGGSWNFGFATLSGFYGQWRIGGLRQDNWFAAASAPIGVWTLKASYGQVRRDGAEGEIDANGQSANQLAFGVVYDLSKRSALYATWACIGNRGGARFIVGGLNNVALGGAAADSASQGAEIGIAHSF